MTDQEFDVLDELYFVISFEALREQVGIEENDLKETLKGLLEKQWVKCLQSVDEEVEGRPDFEDKYSEYYYLATKKGLFAHNTQG